MSNQVRQLREMRTEDPVKEIWSMLGYFESKHNCKQFLENKFHSSIENLVEAANSIAFATSTAREYYEAADKVTVLTRPLLIFYGMTALSKVLFATTHGKKSPSNKHGLQKVKEWSSVFAELSVEVGKDGTFPQFHGCYNKENLSHSQLSIKELLSLVPEIKVEFETVFSEKSRALRVIRTDMGINIVDSELEKYGKLEPILKRVPGFHDKYMDSYQEIGNKIVLWSKDYQARDPTTRSVSGEEYLVLPIERNTTMLAIPEMSTHFLIMYLLGMLSRYQPEEWGKTIKGEDSGEIYIVQKFLEVTKRKFPNLILNELRDRDFVFIGPTFETENKLTQKQLDTISEYVNRKFMDGLTGY